MIIDEQETTTNTPTSELLRTTVMRNMCNFNASYPPFKLTDTERYLSIIMFPISVIVLLGNAWIFQTIVRMKSRKKYYHIIASLSMTDSFLMIACIFVAVECLKNNRSFIYLDYLPDARWVIASYFEVTSLLHVILLACERCVAVKYPFKHRQLQKKQFIYVIIMLWIASIGINACLYVSGHFGYADCHYGTVYLNNGIVALTIVIAVTFHIIIYRTATNSTSRIVGSINRKTLNRNRSLSRLSGSDIKAARTTAIILSGFVVCVTPYVICSNIAYFTKDFDAINSPMLAIGYFLAIFNVVINTIVYGLLNAELRRAALGSLKALCRKGEAAHSYTRRPSDTIYRLRINQLEQCKIGGGNEKCSI
ncbi:octopamine receptor beta-2R-like [Antedon mediterranea]|uniref:octopamine receptor beta-2R-like n=1 Tax=Antedon mediterranea TaxID=105859 RepID=UPI003AF8A26F